jgi:hypothetical protein
MTRTLVADPVMSARARTVSGPHGAVSESPGHLVSVPAQPVSSTSACVRRASRRRVVSACRLEALGRPLPPERTGAPRPPCPRQPVPVHPLYLYLLQWHAATHNRWSFDPGRDI